MPKGPEHSPSLKLIPESSFSSSNPTSPSPSKISVVSPTTKLDREARALNIALEYTLQISLRLTNDNTDLEYFGNKFPSYNLLDSNNISEIICDKLACPLPLGNAISFLVSCYKRLSSKEGTMSEQNITESSKYEIFI